MCVISTWRKLLSETKENDGFLAGRASKACGAKDVEADTHPMKQDASVHFIYYLQPLTSMEKIDVDTFLMMNGKYLPENQLPMIRERLLCLDSNKATALKMLQFKDPNTALMLGIIVPLFGISGTDRLFIGDTGIGIAKMLTCGGCGIWGLIDLFLITDATREKNLELLMMYL